MPFVDNTKKRKVAHETDSRIAVDEWFILRTELTWKQKRTLGLDKMLTITTKSMFGGDDSQIEQGAMRVDFKLAEAEHLRIQAYLLEWHIVDPQTGQIPPITYETVAQLDENTATVLLACIKQLEGESEGETSAVDDPLLSSNLSILEGKLTRVDR